jgi:hypothetical protein
MRRKRRFPPPALPLLAAVALASCNWVSLASNAATYRTTAPGEVANVAVNGGQAYETRGTAGLGVLDPATGEVLRSLPPPAGSESVDDLAVADGLLFVLDAHREGHLSVFSLADPRAPRLVSGPVAVDVGPFSGVSAAGGRVAVSGGTSALSLRTYTAEGQLGTLSATIDLGRGQPDVLLAPGGGRAFVSTHDWGPYFSLTTLSIRETPLALTRRGVLKLDGAGFTSGGAKPASFPLQAALADATTLLVAFAGGLAIIDVSSLQDPKLVRVLDVGVRGVSVAVSDGMAAVVGTYPEPLLVFVDVRDARDAKVLRRVALPAHTLPTGVALGPRHAVLATHEGAAMVVPY